MKSTIFTLLTCILCVSLYGQYADHMKIPIQFRHAAKILHIQEEGDQLRVFLLTPQEVSGKGITRDGENFTINILSAVDLENGVYKNEESHVLYQRIFPMNKNFEFKLGRGKFGSRDNIITYDQVLDKYPELDHIQGFDTENQKLPEEFYTTQLILPSLGKKIKGFKSVAYTMKEVEGKKEESGKKKKKGLMNKLAGAALKLEGIQNDIDGAGSGPTAIGEVNLDWEDHYGGGQDKKNFWQNINQVGCSFSGKLYAYNAQKTKDDKLSYYKNHEFVVFDQQGNLLNREELTSNIEWEILDTKVTVNRSVDYTCPSSTVVLMKSRRIKEPMDYAVRAFSEDGSLLYHHEYDLEISVEDIVYFNSTDEVITIVAKGFASNKYEILQSTANGQTQRVVTDIPNWHSINFLALVQVEDRIVTFYQNPKSKSSFFMNELNNSTQKHYEFSSGLENIEDSSLEVMHKSDTEILIRTKELIKKDFNGLDLNMPLVYTTLYEVTTDGINKLSSSGESNIAMFQGNMDKNNTFYKTDSGLYTIEAMIGPNPKNPSKNMVFNVLTYMKN